MDGIQESKSSLNSLTIYSIKFNNCRNIYPICLIKPCEKYKYDEQEQLRRVLADINDNGLILGSCVFDNPKRSDMRCAKSACAKYGCEYCVNFAVPFVDLNKKSLTMIKKRYETQENTLSKEIDELQQTQADDCEDEHLINLKATLSQVIKEKETEMKKKSRKQLRWPSATMEGNLRTIEDIKAISEEIEKKPNILKTDPEFCKGIKGKSQFLDQPNFNLIHDMPCEYMHLLCLGVVKRMVELNFKVGENRVRNTKRKLTCPQLFNEKIKLIQLTREFSRRCRNLDFGVMKASEYRNLLFFFFPIVLECIEDEFRDDKKIWLHLVYMTRACVLPNEEFQKIDKKLIESACQKFYEMYEKLYGQINCTYSIHVLPSHLLRIRGNQPLTYKSAFKFESFYSEMRNLFHPGTASPLKQILQNCYMKRMLEYHCCEKSMFLSPEKKTQTNQAKENNSMFYTYNANETITIYKVVKIIDKNLFLCNIQGKFKAQFLLTPEYDWSNVGVFKVGPLSEETFVVNSHSISGKVLKVNGYLITCPNNVLFEQ